jgi:hypothetical protein
LPDGIFSHQKCQFWYLLKGLGTEKCGGFRRYLVFILLIGIFYVHLVYFMAIWFFGGYFGIFFPLWFILPRENLATLGANKSDF